MMIIGCLCVVLSCVVSYVSCVLYRLLWFVFGICELSVSMCIVLMLSVYCMNLLFCNLV